MCRVPGVHPAAVAVGLLIPALSAFAETGEWRSADLNFSIEWPAGEGWHQGHSPPGFEGVVFQTQFREKVVAVMVRPVPAGQILDEGFISHFEKEYYSTTTSKKTSGGWTTIGGRRAYQSTGIVSIRGKPDSGRVATQVIDGGRLYQVSGLVVGGDPVADEQVLDSVESFRFLSVPGKESGGRSLAGKLGRLAGKLLLLTAVGLGVWKLIRRRRGRALAG